jgi:hypothetical protein
MPPTQNGGGSAPSSLVVIVVAPHFHPASSCSQRRGWVLGRLHRPVLVRNLDHSLENFVNKKRNQKEKKKLTYGPRDVDDVPWAFFWVCPHRCPPTPPRGCGPPGRPPSPGCSCRSLVPSPRRLHPNCSPLLPREQWLAAAVGGAVVVVLGCWARSWVLLRRHWPPGSGRPLVVPLSSPRRSIVVLSSFRCRPLVVPRRRCLQHPRFTLRAVARSGGGGCWGAFVGLCSSVI